MMINGTPSEESERRGRDFEALLRRERGQLKNWRQEVEGDRAAAITAGQRHPALLRLRATGQALKAHFMAVERERSAVAASTDLSATGRAGRQAQISEAAEVGLNRILREVATATVELTHRPPATPVSVSPGDAARVQALLAVLPTLAPEAAVAELESAAEADDKAVLRYVLPALQTMAAGNGQFTALRDRLLTLAVDADLRLVSPVEAAQNAAAEKGMQLWHSLIALVTNVENNGGRWDPLFERLLPEAA